MFDPYAASHFDGAMQRLAFAADGALQYIAVYPVRPPGWTPLEKIQFRGDVWQATFVPEPFVFLVIADHQLAERATEGPCVVITIGGAGSKPSDVVASARPLADAICGAILLTIGWASLEPRVYEGLITPAENGKLRFSAAKTNVSVHGLSKQVIEAETQRVSSVSSTLAVPHLLLALR